jgi:hypothetical protein
MKSDEPANFSHPSNLEGRNTLLGEPYPPVNYRCDIIPVLQCHKGP